MIRITAIVSTLDTGSDSSSSIACTIREEGEKEDGKWEKHRY